MIKKLCVIAMKPETPNDIGKCQRICATSRRQVSDNETKNTIAPRNQAAPEIVAPYHGKWTTRRRIASRLEASTFSPRTNRSKVGRTERINEIQIANTAGYAIAFQKITVATKRSFNPAATSSGSTTTLFNQILNPLATTR